MIHDRGARRVRSRLLTSVVIGFTAAGTWPVMVVAQAQLPPQIEARIPKPPTVASLDGQRALAYEIHVTNVTADTQTLKRVETLDASSGSAIVTLTDSALVVAIARRGAPVSRADRPKIGPGLRAIVFMWVPVGVAVPATIGHRLSVESGSGDSVRTAVLETSAVPLAQDAPVIGPPLRGGSWLAANGPANESGHRRALIGVAGGLFIAQRFAIDYVKLAENATGTFTGDRLKNTSYAAYGTDALAVADGQVVAVKDGIPENVPGVNSRAVPITMETVGGNHVIVDLGRGKYAFYAHLQPGSIKVKVGDRVRRGQVLGLVGNSGNSTEPHLHFHVSDANSPLGSEGVPYAHESLDVVGRCRATLGDCARGAAETRRGQMPAANQLVRFP